MKIKKVEEKIIVKESVVPLIVRLVSIELLFAIISLFLSYVLTNPEIGLNQNQWIFGLRLISFLIITAVKIWMIVTVVGSWSSSNYTVSRSGVSFNCGIFNNNQKTYACRNIEKVELFQGALGRLANYGHIKLYSPLLEKDLYLKNVANPKKIIMDIKRLLNNQKTQVIYQDYKQDK